MEITKFVLLRNTEATLSALRQLRAMGVSVALDDFGTGYSSLSYLHSFQFSKIKIDQSFVRNLLTNKECTSIIRAVAGLGQSLDIKTIAEGVETMEQLDVLRAQGMHEDVRLPLQLAKTGQRDTIADPSASGNRLRQARREQW